MRLDLLLVNNKYVPTRNKAQILINHGDVLVNDVIITKPSHNCKVTDVIKIANIKQYVSQGAYKLLKAINHWKINIKNKIACDVGSSTGGFTQVLLEQHVKQVYCIDVGTNQLDKSLRDNKKVICWENTNIKAIKKDMVKKINFVVADVSFISLTEVIKVVVTEFPKKLSGVFLIKPQFELSPKEVKSGFIKSPSLRDKAINKILNFTSANNFIIHGYIPIDVNDKKNIEYLMYWSK